MTRGWLVKEALCVHLAINAALLCLSCGKRALKLSLTNFSRGPDAVVDITGWRLRDNSGRHLWHSRSSILLYLLTRSRYSNFNNSTRVSVWIRVVGEQYACLYFRGSRHRLGWAGIISQ